VVVLEVGHVLRHLFLHRPSKFPTYCFEIGVDGRESLVFGLIIKGNTAEFWLNAQRAVDLWEASRTIKEKIKQITPLSAA